MPNAMQLSRAFEVEPVTLAERPTTRITTRIIRTGHQLLGVPAARDERDEVVRMVVEILVSVGRVDPMPEQTEPRRLDDAQALQVQPTVRTLDGEPLEEGPARAVLADVPDSSSHQSHLAYTLLPCVIEPSGSST